MEAGGFASSTVLEKEKIDKMLKDATSLAKSSKPKKKRVVKTSEPKAICGQV